MNWLDYLLGVLLLWGLWKGYTKGFTRTVTNLIGYVAGFVGAIIFSKPVADTMNFTFHEPIRVLVRRHIPLPEVLNTTSMTAFSPDQAKLALTNVPMAGEYKVQVVELINQLGKEAANPKVATVGDGLIYLISDLVLQAVAFMVIFFVIQKAFGLIGYIAAKGFGHGILGSLDGFAGAACGICQTLISFTIMLLIFKPVMLAGEVMGSPEAMQAMVTSVNDSVVLTMLADIVKVFG